MGVAPLGHGGYAIGTWGLRYWDMGVTPLGYVCINVIPFLWSFVWDSFSASPKRKKEKIPPDDPGGRGQSLAALSLDDSTSGGARGGLLGEVQETFAKDANEKEISSSVDLQSLHQSPLSLESGESGEPLGITTPSIPAVKVLELKLSEEDKGD